jgi:hypothetical protein
MVNLQGLSARRMKKLVRDVSRWTSGGRMDRHGGCVWAKMPDLRTPLARPTEQLRFHVKRGRLQQVLADDLFAYRTAIDQHQLVALDNLGHSQPATAAKQSDSHEQHLERTVVCLCTQGDTVCGNHSWYESRALLSSPSGVTIMLLATRG